MFFNIYNDNLFIYLGHGLLRYSSPKCTVKVCCLTQTIHNQVKTNSSHPGGYRYGAKSVAQGPKHRANPSVLENLANTVNIPHKRPAWAKKPKKIKEATITPKFSITRSQIFHDDCTLLVLIDYCPVQSSVY